MVVYPREILQFRVSPSTSGQILRSAHWYHVTYSQWKPSSSWASLGNLVNGGLASESDGATAVEGDTFDTEVSISHGKESANMRWRAHSSTLKNTNTRGQRGSWITELEYLKSGAGRRTEERRCWSRSRSSDCTPAATFWSPIFLSRKNFAIEWNWTMTWGGDSVELWTGQGKQTR